MCPAFFLFVSLVRTFFIQLQLLLLLLLLFPPAVPLLPAHFVFLLVLTDFRFVICSIIFSSASKCWTFRVNRLLTKLWIEKKSIKYNIQRKLKYFGSQVRYLLYVSCFHTYLSYIDLLYIHWTDLTTAVATFCGRNVPISSTFSHLNWILIQFSGMLQTCIYMRVYIVNIQLYIREIYVVCKYNTYISFCRFVLYGLRGINNIFFIFNLIVSINEW